MEKYFKKLNFILLFISVTLFLSSFVVNIFHDDLTLLLISFFVINLLIFSVSIENKLFIIFFLLSFKLISNSIYLLSDYYQVSAYSDFQYFEYKKDVLIDINIFYIFLFLSFFIMKKNSNDVIFVDFKSSKVLFYFCMLVALSFSVLGLSGDSIFDAVYSHGDTKKSALYEYFIIPFLGMILFSGKENKYKLFILCILFFYVLKSFAYGGRIEALQVFYILGLIWFSGFKKLKTIYLLIIGLLGYVVFEAVANFRSGNVIEDNFVKDYMVINTASDVLYASMRIYALIDLGYLGLKERFVSLLGNVFSFIPLSGVWPDYVVLSSYLSEDYLTGGGGLISAYARAWLGPVGAPLIGIWCGYIFSLLFKKCGDFMKIYAVLMIASVPRWLYYSPVGLFKFCFLGAVFLVILNKFNNFLILRNHHENKN